MYRTSDVSFHCHHPSVVTSPGVKASNINNLSVIACHNTKQRRAHLADSKGYCLKRRKLHLFPSPGLSVSYQQYTSLYLPIFSLLLSVLIYRFYMNDYMEKKKQKELRDTSVTPGLSTNKIPQVSVFSHLELEAALKLLNPILSHNQHGFPFILSSN